MISFLFINWDPKPEIFKIPFLDWPVMWYGVLFALGFFIGFYLFSSLLKRLLGDTAQVVKIADRFTFYMVVGTVVGARVGHFLFYEKPSQYLLHPLSLLKVWEGGLSSHGAALGILLAVYLFSRKVKHLGLSFLKLLDFVSIPTAFAGSLIRLGNFVNQEILGLPTTLPWAVLFGHPVDGLKVPRHPVQIYESFFYLFVFGILYRLSFNKKYFNSEGKLIGLFFILVFTFRFFVEFLKVEQSQLISLKLTMGQILSLPLILAGILLFFWHNKTNE